MAKQFKTYGAYTTDSSTGELTYAGNFTYPADFTEKKVTALIAEKLNRANDVVYVKAEQIVEFN